MPPRRPTPQPDVTWLDRTELVGIEFALSPVKDCSLYPDYAIGLQAWFLDQLRQSNPELSAALHDKAEKPFTLSRLAGLPFAQNLTLSADQTYCWSATALNQQVCQWLAQWLSGRPDSLALGAAPMQILEVSIIHPATTYAALLSSRQTAAVLSFCSPTCFRHRGHYLPLPVPKTVFQSYLRRWNDFSGEVIDADDFLDWIDENVVIAQHQIESVNITAGRRSSVTGFIGSVEFSLRAQAQQDEDYAELFGALVQLAPYCGTGQKTTFGLGQTRAGWLADAPVAPIAPPVAESLVTQRIAELTELFLSTKKRQGGQRAMNSAKTWATIVARRELGESLQAIALALEAPYETIKTYAKLARKALNEVNSQQN